MSRNTSRLKGEHEGGLQHVSDFPSTKILWYPRHSPRLGGCESSLKYGMSSHKGVVAHLAPTGRERVRSC